MLAGEERGVLAQQVVHDLGGPGLRDVHRAALGPAVGGAQLEVGMGFQHGAQVTG